MHSVPGNDLNLGKLVGRSGGLGLWRTERDKHLYVCGGTGTGKSKFLENLIRQDIRNWSKSKCGVLVLDPHGALYGNLLNWLAWTGFDRPIIPIDLRQDEWVVSYNLLRQRSSADPAVLWTISPKRWPGGRLDHPRQPRHRARQGFQGKRRAFRHAAFERSLDGRAGARRRCQLIRRCCSSAFVFTGASKRARRSRRGFRPLRFGARFRNQSAGLF